jgi:tripartite ATP-independent transporter DctM subunit
MHIAWVLAVIIVLLVVTLAIGGPVSTSIGFTAVVVTMLFLTKGDLTFLGSVLYQNSVSGDLIMMPMFIMMAEFMAVGGIAEDLYYVFAKLTRRIKGGLAVATTLACTIFAALSGSSPATAATIGKVSLKSMAKRGYREDFAVGTVAGGGTLGIMIPPSITLVMYGILTKTSIVGLLMAGLVPGLLLSFLMCVVNLIRVRVNPALIGETRDGKKLAGAAYEEEKFDTTFWQDLKMAGPALLLILFILVCMYTGAATANECAGIGCVCAMLIALFKKKLDKDKFLHILVQGIKASGMMILLLSAAAMLSQVIAKVGIATAMAKAITDYGINKWVIMILLFAMWYLLGMIMNPTAMVTLTIPFVFQPLMELGFNAYWLGIVSTLCVEVAMISPPVGNNLFILKQTCDVDIGTVYKGALPYVGILTLGLIIFCVCPQITTFAVDLMMR